MGSASDLPLLLAAAYSLVGVVILIHEMGHAVAFRMASAKRVTITVGRAGPSIRLRFADFEMRVHAGLNGGRCEFERTGLTIGQIRRIGYAGPLASAIGCVGFAFLAITTRHVHIAIWPLLAAASFFSFSGAVGNLASIRSASAGSSDGRRLKAIRNLPRDATLVPTKPTLPKGPEGSYPSPQIPSHDREDLIGRS